MNLQKENFKTFTSDNNSGVLPQMLEAMAKANQGHVHAYGGDPITEKAIKTFQDFFSKDISVHFVFNGTGANVLSIKALLKPYEAVLCAETSHLNLDECGAPEALTGCKLKLLPSPNGKISIDDLEKHYVRMGDQHSSQVKMVSITQPTEYGTIYTQEEMKAIGDWAKKRNLYFHIDGARFPNACITLKKSFKELSEDVGAHVLSFGGTKNGLAFGEAVIFFNRTIEEIKPLRDTKDFKFHRKQLLQLCGKMRFISSQFQEYLSNDLWKKVATHANDMALFLRDQLKSFPQVKITQEVQSNAVFAIFPKEWIHPLRENSYFYIWEEHSGEARLMTSFDTSQEQILEFKKSIQKLAR